MRRATLSLASRRPSRTPRLLRRRRSLAPPRTTGPRVAPAAAGLPPRRRVRLVCPPALARRRPPPRPARRPRPPPAVLQPPTPPTGRPDRRPAPLTTRAQLHPRAPLTTRAQLHPRAPRTTRARPQGAGVMSEPTPSPRIGLRRWTTAPRPRTGRATIRRPGTPTCRPLTRMSSRTTPTRVGSRRELPPKKARRWCGAT